MINKLSLATAAAVATVVGSANMASAAIFNFSFSNVEGAVPGTVEGTIELPDGDGIFAATAVTITSFPMALGLPPAPIDALAAGSLENTFTVVGGNIDSAATSFFGLINGATALSLSNSVFDGSTFLDAFNAGDLGASGVRDAASSTLVFSVVPEPLTILGAGTAVGFGAFFKGKLKGKQDRDKA